MEQCFFTSRNNGAIDRKYRTNNIASRTVTRPVQVETSKFVSLNLITIHKLLEASYSNDLKTEIEILGPKA